MSPSLSAGVRRARPSAFLRTCLPTFALMLCCCLPVAQAQSKRERDLDALKARMTVAETRYREALVKVDNSDPSGMQESNAALEDMEDVITACLKVKGCPISELLSTYKRLLKSDVDVRADDEDAVGDAPQGLIDSELASVDVPRAGEAASLLSADGERFVKMVQVNPAVQAGIRRWLTDMRGSLINTHENYQYLRPMMAPAFQRNGLPEALLFGIMAKESTGRVHIGSRAGAVGLLQFMPSTGRRFGLGPDGTGFDTRYDPKMSSEAAAAYLSERYAEFGNNIELWLAAYNGGEGRALRVYQSTGGRSFWDGDVYDQFPAETRDYVPMVIAAAWLYLHPKEYGLTFPKVDARPVQFKLQRPASIYELTICLGNGGTRDGFMRALRNLNPRYEADAWIPSGTVLNGTVKIAGLYQRYCVQGERYDLAKRLVGSDASSAVVRVGAIEAVTATASGEDGTAVPQAAAAAPKPPAAQPRERPKPKPVRRHRVARGDTLMSIARKYDCSVAELAKANGLKAPRYTVHAGQQIVLRGCGD